MFMLQRERVWMYDNDSSSILVFVKKHLRVCNITTLVDPPLISRCHFVPPSSSAQNYSLRQHGPSPTLPPAHLIRPGLWWKQEQYQCLSSSSPLPTRVSWTRPSGPWGTLLGTAPSAETSPSAVASSSH